MLISITLILSIKGTGQGSLRLIPSICYNSDLSDTYGGGNMLSGEIEISRGWYGASLGIGFFQSKSTSVLKIPLLDTIGTLNIPFDEISIMHVFSISGVMKPVNNKFVSLSILLGGCYDKSECLTLKGVDYSYDVKAQKFIYLNKDYQLKEDGHFGYQVGISVTFFVRHNIGLELKSQIQDLINRGSFFFVGGGLSFKI